MTHVPYQLPSDRTLFFMHIPKTAGTTFSQVMHQYFAPHEIYPVYEWWDLFALPLSELANYRYVAGHFAYNVHMLMPQKPLYLTFLRDPIERVLSQLQYLKDMPDDSYWGKRIDDRSNYRKFIMAENPRPMVNNVQTRFIAGPQTPFHAARRVGVDDDRLSRVEAITRPYNEPDERSDAAMLALAKERLRDEFVFMGITERFQESLHLLAYKFGWDALPPPPPRRVSTNRLQWDDLDTDLQQRLLELNQLDIELYEYAQTLFAERYTAMQRDLLTQHYQRTYHATLSPTDTLHIDMSHVLPGTGWHAAEPHAEFGAYRWMSAPTAHLDLPLVTDKALQVRLTVIDSVTQEIAHDLRLQLDGDPLPTEIAYHVEESKITYTGVIPPRDRPAGYSRLSICIDEVLPGSRKIAHETRQLGVAVTNVEVTPAHDA